LFFFQTSPTIKYSLSLGSLLFFFTLIFFSGGFFTEFKVTFGNYRTQ
jgi:hypothetical protein